MKRMAAEFSEFRDIAKYLDVGETDSRNWDNSVFARLSVSPRVIGLEDEIGSERP